MSTVPTEVEVRALVAAIVAEVTAGDGPPRSDPGTPASKHAPEPSGPAEIALGADHGGYRLKERIAGHLRERGTAIYDCGTDSTDSVDYPDFAHGVAHLVADGTCTWGIVVDGAGIGSAMAANKVPGIRAANAHDTSMARNAREHNYANVLTLGARMIGEGLALEIVDTFLTTSWGAERHGKRVAKITAIEERYSRPRPEEALEAAR